MKCILLLAMTFQQRINDRSTARESKPIILRPSKPSIALAERLPVGINRSDGSPHVSFNPPSSTASGTANAPTETLGLDANETGVKAVGLHKLGVRTLLSHATAI